MNGRLTRYAVLGLLYLVFLVYRLAFWDDFKYLELLQIVLNSFFDLCVTCLLSLTFYRMVYTEFPRLPKILYIFIKAVIFVSCYYLCVKLLQFLHAIGYETTTGMTREFSITFYLVSYQVFDTYIVLAFGMMLLLTFLFYEKFTREKIEKEHAEKEKTLSELRFLKAQINPHFIFNTLNNIHFLIDKGNREARQLIQEFCELLRFQLYETGNDKVNIHLEIQYLHNYIHIQKIRKEHGFMVRFEISEGISGEIAPMLMVILIENAFKYTGSSEKDYINIDLIMESGNFLTLLVVNTIDCKVVSSNSRGGGLGLSNLQKRLDLIYGDDARLTTEKDDDLYRAALKIKL